MKRFILFLTAVILIMTGVVQGAPGDWNIFLDASAVTRITIQGDSLWCATNGGILLFDLTDSTFTQFLDGLELKSTDISAVTMDSGGSLWAAFSTSGIVRIDDPGGEPDVFYYRKNDITNEILSDSVTCIMAVQDEVYYGCVEGVGKFFEGIHSLETNLSDNLEGERVNDIFYDPADNTLWVAFDKGVGRFDRSTLIYTAFPIGESYSICMHDGDIYCATLTGVQRFDGSSWAVFGAGFHVMPPLGISSGNGEIFAVTSERTYRYNGTYWEGQGAVEMKMMFVDLYRIFSYHIKTIAVDRNGTPWIGGRTDGTTRGSYISAYSDGAWQNRAMGLLSQNEIVALSIAPDEGIWASTKYGISYRSGEGDWISYTKMRPDLPHDDALSYYSSNLALLYDSQGYLWCNSLNYDLDQIDVGDIFDRGDDVWSHYSVTSGTSIVSDRFVQARQDPAGNRWFLSDDDQQQDGKWGINIANSNADGWLSINPATTPEMASGSVFDCVFSQTRAYLALRGFGVQSWYTGASGFAWSSLENDSDDIWTTILDQNDLPNTQLSSIELADDGSLWIGTSGGLVKYRSGQIDSFTLKTGYNDDGLVGGMVNDLEIDSYGNIWVATNQGLNRINSSGEIDRVFTTAVLWEDRFQFVYPNSVISPLPSHNCVELACDRAGDILWIATDNGLARLDITPQAEVVLPVKEAILYPNPLHISRGDEFLYISRITGSVSIKVFSLEGELVHEADGVVEEGQAWDLRTLNGYQARSGIYIVKIIGEKSTETRKVAVIR